MSVAQAASNLAVGIEVYAIASMSDQRGCAGAHVCSPDGEQPSS